eukprot:g4483.t1
MGKKRRNKKKQSKTQNQQQQCLITRQDVLDELLALEAVFGEDITIHPNKEGFSLIIVPNSSDVESNFVFLTLQVHYTTGYPDQSPVLKFAESTGISESESTALFDELTQLATELSKLKDVFLFTLIDHCQETLRQLNETIQAQVNAELDAAFKSIKYAEPSLGFGQIYQESPPQGLFDEGLIISPQLKSKTKQNRPKPGVVEIQDLSLKDRTVVLPHQPSRDLEDGLYGTGVSTSMLSLVANMVEKIGPLPTAIATYLGLSQTENEEQNETSVFRTEVLIGHLLRLLTSGKTGFFQKEMLPFLCTELQEKGILPKWLHWILLHKPTEIDFSRKTDINNSQSLQLQQFWNSPVEGASMEDRKDRVSTSRYYTDFEEVRVFGRGGFGIVVGAFNRLDGRQYAIKKIKLFATSINAYTKIIREVSTLARLQHPNVVRYFQAWLEPSSELDDELQSEDSMNLDALLETNSDSLDTDHLLASQESNTFSITDSRLPPMHPMRDPGKLPVLQEHSSTSSESSFLSASSQSRQLAPQIVFESGSMPRSQELATENESKEVRHQILYIQMEACPRTLQQIMQSGNPLAEDEKWEILRQILQGLAYIHSQRTIHRDLKPANIFYSSTGEIKLGDFGLAKFATTNEAVVTEGNLPSTPSRHIHTTETSGICGTSFYIAPEIENGWPSYDSQVDMYSLGIVLFEIWHPFATLMERILTLKELKEKGTFPMDWQRSNPEIAKLVLWLLSPIPSKRPTAKTLLRSEFLPTRVGNEQVQDLIRSLDHDPETYNTIIDGVFQSAQNSRRHLGPSVLAGAPLVQSRDLLEYQDQLLQSIKEVLSRHGVAQMTSQDAGLGHSWLPSDAVRVLSTSGELHSLKYDMRYPFVDWLVHEFEKAESEGWTVGNKGSEYSLENLRRFDLDWICREGQGENLVRKHLQIDVDFVTAVLPSITETTLHDSVLLHKLLSEQLLSEAELLKIVSEIANCFRFSDQECSIEIRLTHTALLHHCLEDVGLDKSILHQTLKLLSMAGRFSPLGSTRQENWSPVQTALEGLGLSSSQLRNLKRFTMKFAGSTDVVIPQLRSALSNGGNKMISLSTALALEEIRTLVNLLQKWNLGGDQVILDPIMIPEMDYYSGIYFQVHLIHPQKRTGKLFAIGGRYEKLLKSLWKTRMRTTGSSPSCGLIGTTLNLTPFIKQKLESMGQSSFCRSSSDVLVCSKGGGASSLEVK